MVQILPEVPSFGSQFAQALGGGIGRGLSGTTALGAEMALERMKKRERQNLLNMVESQGMYPGAERELQTKFAQQFTPEATGEALDLAAEAPSDPLKQLRNQETLASMKAKQYAAMGEHDLSRVASEEANRLAKERIAERRYTREREEFPRKEYEKMSYKTLGDFMEKINSREADLPSQEISLQMIQEASEDPSKWPAFREFLAEKTGYAGFRTARGKELDSAIKNYFIGDLASIKGGRPNVFIEQQLRGAYQELGVDPVANMKILVGQKMSHDLVRKEVEVTRALEEKFLQKQGYLPTNFQAQVKAQLKPFAEQVEKRAIQQLQQLSNVQKEGKKILKSQLNPGEVLMLSPEGQYEAVPKESLTEARQSGYIKINP